MTRIKEDAVGSRLNPYIAFTGDAKQAMEFYQSVFGGELTMSTFGEFGTPDPAIADQIMHAMLETGAGYTLMASDTPPGMTRTPGDNITISLSGDDSDALRGYWNQLSSGGQVSVPLEKQMWGDEFGQCTDRFGVNWMVNISQPQG
jgi:PhnB protein